MLYTALIGYIYYEAPKNEQNFSTLVEMINAMEVREDDESFKNAVDLLFDALEQKDPDQTTPEETDYLALAMQEINGAQSETTLVGIYNNYQPLHTNKQFMQALTNRKNALNNGTR